MKKILAIEINDSSKENEDKVKTGIIAPEKVNPDKEKPDVVDHKEERIQRRMLSLARAIAKRTKTKVPSIESLKKTEGKDKKKVYSLEMNLTQKQIDGLPIGLKKLLK